MHIAESPPGIGEGRFQFDDAPTIAMVRTVERMRRIFASAYGIGSSAAIVSISFCSVVTCVASMACQEAEA